MTLSRFFHVFPGLVAVLFAEPSRPQAILGAAWNVVRVVSNDQAEYLSYLLRLWREKDRDRPVWRASLERSRTAERQVFPSLDDLFEYLRWQTGVGFDADGDDDETATGR